MDQKTFVQLVELFKDYAQTAGITDIFLDLKWGINMCRLVQIVFVDIFGDVSSYDSLFYRDTSFSALYATCNTLIAKRSLPFSAKTQQMMCVAIVNLLNFLVTDCNVSSSPSKKFLLPYF